MDIKSRIKAIKDFYVGAVKSRHLGKERLRALKNERVTSAYTGLTTPELLKGTSQKLSRAFLSLASLVGVGTMAAIYAPAPVYADEKTAQSVAEAVCRNYTVQPGDGTNKVESELGLEQNSLPSDTALHPGQEAKDCNGQVTLDDKLIMSYGPVQKASAGNTRYDLALQFSSEGEKYFKAGNFKEAQNSFQKSLLTLPAGKATQDVRTQIMYQLADASDQLYLQKQADQDQDKDKAPRKEFSLRKPIETRLNWYNEKASGETDFSVSGLKARIDASLNKDANIESLLDRFYVGARGDLDRVLLGDIDGTGPINQLNNQSIQFTAGAKQPLAKDGKFLYLGAGAIAGTEDIHFLLEQLGNDSITETNYNGFVLEGGFRGPKTSLDVIYRDINAKSTQLLERNGVNLSDISSEFDAMQILVELERRLYWDRLSGVINFELFEKGNPVSPGSQTPINPVAGSKTSSTIGGGLKIKIMDNVGAEVSVEHQSFKGGTSEAIRAGMTGRW